MTGGSGVEAAASKANSSGVGAAASGASGNPSGEECLSVESADGN